MTTILRSGRVLSHLAHAAAVAATCSAPAAAGIITWTVNRAIPTTIDGLYVRIDTQATTTSAGTALPGWDINPYGSTSLNFFASTASPNPASTYVRTQTSGGPTNLAAGTVVGPTSTFANSTTAVITSAGVGSNGWSLNATHYVGFRFNPGTTTGTVRYGYAVVQVGATVTERTLVSVHWEDTGAPITVGPPAPPPCPADLNDDGSVNGMDLGIMLGNWDTANPLTDLNSDGSTNGIDLGILLGGWGDCPV